MLSIDTDYTTRVLQDLVRINSVNPVLDPSAPASGRLPSTSTAHGGAWRRGALPRAAARSGQRGRPAAGIRPGRTLMLNAHADTVDVAGMDEPFSGEFRDGRLYGRGSFDMKGGLAAMMGAVKALADAGRPHGGEVLLAAVADEEYASLGTEDLVGRYRPDGAIVTEPTALDICLAHKGFAWIEVTTHGTAAHGSRFDLGIDANMRMGRVLAGPRPPRAGLATADAAPAGRAAVASRRDDSGRLGPQHLRGVVPSAGRAPDDPRREARGHPDEIEDILHRQVGATRLRGGHGGAARARAVRGVARRAHCAGTRRRVG